MEKLQPGRHSFRNGHYHGVRAVGLGLLFTLMLSGTAFGQQIAISGTVTSASGAPLRGVSVRLQGAETRSFTNASGKYSIAAPSNGTLSFTIIGQRAVTTPIEGRTTIDVRMDPIAFLEEVVVTAYSEEQRRGAITGAVATVNLGAVERQTSASVLQRLDATVTGVTVDASGSPGSRSTVRIRGISSFQNNDPLYVVDGTPVNDTYINWLNPNDIASVQVLKDASAASIYGSRASNGVVIIETTKRGVAGPPRVTFSVRTGMATPVRGYDDFLIQNSLDYFEIVKRSYLNAGYPIDSVPTNIYGSATNPTVPKYIWPNNCGPAGKTGPCSTVDPSTYAYPNTLIMPGSAGTNWWKAVFGSAPVSDYNLNVSGGGEENAYAVSFNYFNQGGTAKYNDFKRGSIRANTSFNRGALSFGENVALSLERHFGGVPDDAFGENGILGKNILSQPVVPIYDINGNFASGKAVGLGNNSNPLKEAWVHRDDQTTNDRIFGNVFAAYAFTPQLSVRSRLGFNLGQGAFNGFTPIYPENSEASFSNLISENQSQFTDWTLSNTAKYDRKFFDTHSFSLLVGQEANAGTNRFLTGQCANVLTTDVGSRYVQDALCDASTKNVSSTGGRSALLSLFGKADYNFEDKYVASVTLREDGSSRLGPGHRWGTFPAFGLGWRVSKEQFMAGNHLFSDVMLRFGWGVTGNQAIPAGRIVSQFGGDRGDTFYDVGGSNTSIQPGFRLRSLGNVDLKWEENRSTNIGADVALFDGRVNVVLDVYRRQTNNLLFDPPIPAAAGVASPPIVNIGKMQNNGIDFSVGHQTATWTVFFNGSHYSNKIISIDGVSDFFYGPISTRYGNQVINQVGHPIGAFYGLVADGFFPNAADATSHATVNGTCPVAPCQDGAAQGRLRFKDINGDKKITLADRTIIGTPHPDFTAGLDMGYRRGNWDLSATVFGTFGNDIFDVQKEFYVFRNFSTNVRKDLLTDSWTPENPNAKYPRLDINDNYSHAISSFYVENGSYVRLRNVQVGYNVPARFARWVSATRVYVQAENLFTITGYDGLDPALPAANVTGPAGDIRDQYRGIDRGTYPSNRTFSIGLVTNF
jgi:TonB-linked SusC/RagA family outer membrane protein